MSSSVRDPRHKEIKRLREKTQWGKKCQMENNGKHVRENKWMRDKESAREMWVSKKCQCQASFRHEWETMRPGGVWMVRERTYKHARIAQAQTHTHAHTLPTEPEPVPVRQVYGSIEGMGRELSLSVELMKPAPTGIKEWRVSTALLHPFTHFLPLHSSWWGNAFSLKGIP